MTREGGDITAADMLQPIEEPSEILEFFTGSTIFITGTTGYLGSMFLEKLLRTCNTLNLIYILIRPKKGKNTQDRFNDLFNGPNYEPLKRQFPNFVDKIKMVEGDCALPNLGLTNDIQQEIIKQIDCIIHCAATVRFDQTLRIAAYINVRSVKDLMAMAKQMKQLKVFMYISTAYANCPYSVIDEEFYPAPIKSDKLLTLVETLEETQLNAITPIIIDKYPNTYVFTKAIAENLIKDEAEQLPIAVFRPAIVIGSVKEPIAGWMDNFYGVTGMFLGLALGLLRMVYGHKETTAEVVPADYVINCALAACWNVASIKSINNNKQIKQQRNSHEEKFEKKIPIYNFVTSPLSRIDYVEFIRLTKKHAKQIPSPLLVWHYFSFFTSNRYLYLIGDFCFQTVPAYIVDFILILMRKEPIMVKGYEKIKKFSTVVSHFILNKWHFKNNNVQTLWQHMNNQDRSLFEFNMKNFNWDSYFYTYVRGARVYLLKDPLETIPQGRIKYYKLMFAHYTLVTIVFYLLYKFVFFLLSFVF